MVTASTPTIAQSPIQTPPLISTVTPAALVVAKPLESSHTLTLSSQSTGLQPILPAVRLISINICTTKYNILSIYNILFHCNNLITQILQPQQQIQPQSQQAIVLNGKIQNQVNRPTVITSKSKNSDLIDLTDEEEKNKCKFTILCTYICDICISHTLSHASITTDGDNINIKFV